MNPLLIFCGGAKVIARNNCTRAEGSEPGDKTSSCVVSVKVVMEYVGGGSVSNLLRNPDSGPVRGEVRREGGIE